MTLYGQEPEADLLGAFIAKLGSRVVVDVGAERGSFAQALLDAGADELHAIEPEPANAEALRRRFGGDGRVHVHEVAVSVADGELELHRSVDPTGAPVPFGHTLLERPDTDEIAWREKIRVDGRSLASLVDRGQIPRRVGILKVDTEGHDLAVVSALGGLDADVVMVEHWMDLPHSLGLCPWTTEEMVSTLAQHGFSHFAFIVHRGELVSLQWDDGDVPSGHMGNLIFVHDRVLGDVLSDVLACAVLLTRTIVELATVRSVAADDRLALIDELSRGHEAALKELQHDRDLQADAAVTRLEAIEKLKEERDLQGAAADEGRAAIKKLKHEHAAVVEELRLDRDLQAAAADERLAAIEKLKHERGVVVEELRRERDLQADAPEERLETIEELIRERQARTRAVEDLQANIEGLVRERDLQAQAAEERLGAIEALEAERDLQAEAAAERLATIEVLRAELELQSDAAAERLGRIEELTQERDLQATAAKQRLAAMEDVARERSRDTELPPEGWR